MVYRLAFAPCCSRAILRPAKWSYDGQDVFPRLQHRCVVESVPESGEQTAVRWSKRPEGGKPVAEFMGNERKQPRKPKLTVGLERLTKVLAATGVSTYKKAHAIILAGMVRVNGKIVKQPTQLVNPVADEIYIHGSLVKPNQEHIYYIVNKSPDVSCHELLRELDMVDLFASLQTDVLSPLDAGGAEFQRCQQSHKLVLAGRLDSNTCGLQLITTDADWAQAVTCSTEVQQEFIASLDRAPSRQHVEQIAAGCAAGERIVKPVHVSALYTSRLPRSWRLKIVVKKTRARAVWQLINNSGLQCLKLQRVRLGSLRLPDRLQPGEGEPLSGTDKYRMLDSQATRSMILNSSPGMLVTRTVKAFHLPKSRPAQRSALVDAR